MNQDPRQPRTRREGDGRPRASVLAPAWEHELRAGQTADGEQGSVEPELAIVHLLRHAAAPEPLASREAEAVWSAVEREIMPAPWWRAPWLRWTVPLVAVAAAMLLVIVIPIERAHEAERGLASNTPAAEPEPASSAVALEAQFAVLAPEARERLRARVDDERGTLRARLLASVLSDVGPSSGTPPSAGGAP